MRKLLSFVRNVASPDLTRRKYAAKLFGEFLTGDYRPSWHQLCWLEDRDFNAFLDRFDELDGFNTQRRWMLWQLLRLASHVPGDTAECGSYHGCGSWLICAANRQSPYPRTHHIFDSFEGVSEPGPDDGDHWEKGSMAVGEDRVVSNLLPFMDMVELHKGWIPDRFPDVKDRRFSFVHVDVDLAQPTFDSLAFFYDRLNPGGVLVCDDYYCTTCPGATKVVDEFLFDKPEKMVALDAGGGFIVKGTQTSVMIPAMETRRLVEECPRCRDAA